DKIKRAFKGDEQYMILKTFYRQNHYHPIYALRSSFGLLIQVPFFIAAYQFISHLELLNGVSFYFIKDLSSPDALFSINGFKINILPIAMTLITCVSNFIYTKGLPVKEKVQLYSMAALFLILLYNSPSALVLYWTMNNVFSLFKNIYYRVKSKYKLFVLLGFFSFCCVLLAIFLQIKFTHNSNGQKIFVICVLLSVFPWIFLYIKNQIKVFFNKLIKYDKTKTLFVFILSIFLIWCVFALFIPSQLISSSPQEFSFIDNYTNPLYFIFNVSLQSFGMFIFLPFCLYFLFSDNFKKYFSIAFLAFAFGIIINVFLYSGNYGNISIDFILTYGPVHSNKESFFNICVMLVPLAAAFILYIQNNKNFIIIPLSLFIISIMTISVINISKINNSYVELKKYYVNEQIEFNDISPIFTLSRNGKNVVILMLDRAVSVFIPYIFEESPLLKTTYSGFTYYPNTVSFNGYTIVGAVPIFGGYEYTPLEMDKKSDVLLVEKHNEALLLLPGIFTENNYSVCVTDPPYANYQYISDLSIYNVYPEVKAHITDKNYTNAWLNENQFYLPKTSSVIKRNMFLYSIFRGLPLFLRQPLYMDGEWVAANSYAAIRLALNGYAVIDYLPLLTDITDDTINTALIMVNNTTHKDAYFLAPDYTPSLSIGNYGSSPFSKRKEYHTTAAALHRLGDWFEYLKKEKLYDNTRIILVSDHGHERNFVFKTDLPFNFEQYNALLMIKDFNNSGEIKTDVTFMSNADVPYLSMVDLIDNPVNPFTGKIVSNEQKNDPLYILMSKFPDKNVRHKTQFEINPEIDYYVHDNIFIQENWKKAN
ncbi:MAG: YidC/Oxa1 family membrane protein insertase, partial [Treponema sp.]|nr:YidC/Oxa1 family membrane protein insertase [Treponema sp.]